MNQTRAPQTPQPQQYQPGPPDHPQLVGMQAAPISRFKQFQISFRSEMDGQLYEGQFTTKKLAIRDLAAIGVRKVQLNSGYHFDETHPGVGIDAQTDWMNSMIAHLEIALVQVPMWFKIEDIMDGGLLAKVFEQVMEFENSFFRSSGAQAGNSGRSQDASSSQSQESGAAGLVTALVGGQIPPSLDP